MWLEVAGLANVHITVKVAAIAVGLSGALGFCVAQAVLVCHERWPRYNWRDQLVIMTAAVYLAVAFLAPLTLLALTNCFGARLLLWMDALAAVAISYGLVLAQRQERSNIILKAASDFHARSIATKEQRCVAKVGEASEWRHVVQDCCSACCSEGPAGTARVAEVGMWMWTSSAAFWAFWSVVLAFTAS
jgi:hypothetical protein